MRQSVLRFALALAAALAAWLPARPAAPQGVEPTISMVTVEREIVDTHSSRWRHIVHIYGFNFSRVTEVAIDGGTGPTGDAEPWEITYETLGTTGQIVIHVRLSPVDEAQDMLDGKSGSQPQSHTISVTNIEAGTDGEPRAAGSASATVSW